MRYLASLILSLIVAVAASAQGVQPPEKPNPVKNYGRGYKPPSKEVLDARHKAAHERHNSRMKSLPRVTLSSYDLRTLGCVPAVRDQGPCGSCYQFSGADTCEIAFMKAGLMPVGNGLAKQYGMDCQNWGGCNGGDEAQVIDWW